jgi:hypothetical protein
VVNIPARSDFTPKEREIIQAHRTPARVQRLLSSIPYNHEQGGPTCFSFRRALRENRAHCLEAAIVAAVILEQHGHPPLLVSVESQDYLDHVLFLYKEGGRYGAVAKSRDIGLHGRKPLFRTPRDLVLSYFEAYIDSTGRITGYAVADLNELGGYDWRLSEQNVWKVERHLQEIAHRQIKSSDLRYEKWRRRYIDFRAKHPGGQPDYLPRSESWLV